MKFSVSELPVTDKYYCTMNEWIDADACMYKTPDNMNLIDRGQERGVTLYDTEKLVEMMGRNLSGTNTHDASVTTMLATNNTVLYRDRRSWHFGSAGLIHVSSVLCGGPLNRNHDHGRFSHAMTAGQGGAW